jgi:hypothetical protein
MASIDDVTKCASKSSRNSLVQLARISLYYTQELLHEEDCKTVNEEV